MTTRTWGLLPRPTRPALYSQADVYPSRRRFAWFLTTVPDHCAAKQVFSIPPFGVHREKGQQVFGELTRATSGSDDFANDDFFPDLGNLILDDMGDNINTSGAPPAASYVILSFLFEIVVEFMFLVCAQM